MGDRRLRRIRIAPELLVDMCKTDSHLGPELHTCEGLPDDAMFLRAYTHDSLGGQSTIFLVVHSRAFEDLAEGQEIPEIPVTFTYAEGA